MRGFRWNIGPFVNNQFGLFYHALFFYTSFEPGLQLESNLAHLFICVILVLWVLRDKQFAGALSFHFRNYFQAIITCKVNYTHPANPVTSNWGLINFNFRTPFLYFPQTAGCTLMQEGLTQI
jgi:hypothetical protein